MWLWIPFWPRPISISKDNDIELTVQHQEVIVDTLTDGQVIAQLTLPQLIPKQAVGNLDLKVEFNRLEGTQQQMKHNNKLSYIVVMIELHSKYTYQSQVDTPYQLFCCLAPNYVVIVNLNHQKHLYTNSHPSGMVSDQVTAEQTKRVGQNQTGFFYL